MSDTVKLIIEIPNEMHEQIKGGYVPLGISKYLKNGTPLDDIKAQINKLIGDTDSIYGTSALYKAIDILDRIGKESEE